MSNDPNDEFRSWWDALPPGVKARPASEEELAHFEESFGPIPQEYRSFLRNFGGGVVGSDWVDSIEDLGDSQLRFRRGLESACGWTMQGVFVIGWDGAGNPFGIEQSTGRVLTEDHTFGGIHEMARSFTDFLRLRTAQKADS